MEVEAFPPHRFTVEEYHRLDEVGILAPDVLVKLLDGRIYDLPPNASFHSDVGVAELF